jgi:hypothetical protein
LVEVSQRLVGVALQPIGDPSLLVRERILWAKAYCLLVVGNRLLKVASKRVGVASGPVRPTVFGLPANQFGKVCDRLIQRHCVCAIDHAGFPVPDLQLVTPLAAEEEASAAHRRVNNLPFRFDTRAVGNDDDGVEKRQFAGQKAQSKFILETWIELGDFTEVGYCSANVPNFEPKVAAIVVSGKVAGVELWFPWSMYRCADSFCPDVFGDGACEPTIEADSGVPGFFGAAVDVAGSTREEQPAAMTDMAAVTIEANTRGGNISGLLAAGARARGSDLKR